MMVSILAAIGCVDSSRRCMSLIEWEGWKRCRLRSGQQRQFAVAAVAEKGLKTA